MIEQGEQARLIRSLYFRSILLSLTEGEMGILCRAAQRLSAGDKNKIITLQTMRFALQNVAATSFLKSPDRSPLIILRL